MGALSHDETLRRAFLRSLERFRAQHPNIEWRSMAGMRDRLIHDYFCVDYELVRDVVRNRIPELRGQLAAVLNGRVDR